VRAIDEARAALATPTRALALLDSYAQSYPNGRLKQEALVLRVQALVGAGRREQAAALVRKFNSEHPNSPYGQRLHSLLALR
jgi:outer membrane protein assembly factor BamD (BamD/ComL family)